MTFDCKANTCLCDGSCFISLFIQQCVSTIMFSSHVHDGHFVVAIRTTEV